MAGSDKPRIIVGIGCRRGVSAEAIMDALDGALRTSGLAYADIAGLASAELKRDELGLRIVALKLGKPIRFFSADELNSVEVPHPSLAAQNKLGINSVCEASALLAVGAQGKLILGKQVSERVTVAIAEENL